MPSYPPNINVDGEEYDRPVNKNTEGLMAKGFYPQGAVTNDEVVGLERDGSGNLVLKDSITGTKTLADLGTGISISSHRTLLQLIHFIDNGPAEGFTTGATRTTTGTAFPSQVLWRRSDATKLVEKNITYTGAFPTTIEWKMYAADGTTVLATVTDTITYSGAFETGRTRAIA
jgi:hypothetical protein